MQFQFGRLLLSKWEDIRPFFEQINDTEKMVKLFKDWTYMWNYRLYFKDDPKGAKSFDQLTHQLNSEQDWPKLVTALKPDRRKPSAVVSRYFLG